MPPLERQSCPHHLGKSFFFSWTKKGWGINNSHPWCVLGNNEFPVFFSFIYNISKFIGIFPSNFLLARDYFYSSLGLETSPDMFLVG